MRVGIAAGYAVALAFFVGILIAIVAARRVARGQFRRLHSTVRARISGGWSDRLDGLRDQLARTVSEQRLAASELVLGASRATTSRPAVAITVTVAKPYRRMASFLAILSRDGKRSFALELRSGSPLRRPSLELSLEVMNLVERAVVSIAGVENVTRSSV